MLAAFKDYNNDESSSLFITYQFIKPVLIAEQHGVVREGIKNIIGDFFSAPRVDEARSHEEYVSLSSSNEYDVIILDQSFIETTNDHSTISNCSNNGERKILVTTDPGSVVKCFGNNDQSILGYVSKSCEKNEFAFAIDSVARGRCYICPENAKNLIDRCRRGIIDINEDNGEKLNLLSARELEVARLIHGGMTSKEIAVSLSISPATVDRHRNNILKKLNIHRSHELRNFFN